MATDPMDDLDQREGRLRRNLEATVADLISVIRADIGTFMEREVRNRFVNNEAFAESVDDATLVELKNSLKKRADDAGTELAKKLSEDMDFWFGPQVPEGEGKTFEAHTPLMEALEAIAGATADLLTAHGFPEDEGGGYQIRYTPPAYFVDGKYAPGLAESFWKNLAQLNELRNSRKEQDVGRRRALQRHRWDSIEKKG